MQNISYQNQITLYCIYVVFRFFFIYIPPFFPYVSLPTIFPSKSLFHFFSYFSFLYLFFLLYNFPHFPPIYLFPLSPSPVIYTEEMDVARSTAAAATRAAGAAPTSTNWNPTALFQLEIHAPINALVFFFSAVKQP
jgi:hypothetical protein